MRREALGEDLVDDLSALWPGKAMEASLVREGELVVFQSEQVKDGGVEIAEVNLSLHGLGPGLVGAAVSESSLHSASSQPEGESGRLVAGLVLLVGWFQARPAKFAPPDHKSIIEESALIKVPKECGNGRVG